MSAVVKMKGGSHEQAGQGDGHDGDYSNLPGGSWHASLGGHEGV